MLVKRGINLKGAQTVLKSSSVSCKQCVEATSSRLISVGQHQKKGARRG